VEIITFVIEFEDGKAPPVHAHMEAFGGKVVSVAFHDALRERDGPQMVATKSAPINGMRCMFCNGMHPIGVACPLVSVTTAVRDA